MRAAFYCVLIATTASPGALALSWSSSPSPPKSSNTKIKPLDHVLLASDDAPRAAKSAAVRSMVRVQLQQKELDRQREAAAVALKFTESQFDPWTRITNPHIQTIGGFILRDTAASYLPRRDEPDAAKVQRIWQGILEKVQQSREEKTTGSFWDTRELIETKNGDDWFHVDSKYYGRGVVTGTTSSNYDDDNPKPKHVLLIHGLESNSNSTLTQQLAQACGVSGAATTVTCINFRSCSVDAQGKTIPNQTPAGYHLGFTDDLIHYLEILKARQRDEDIYLIGFSLGANVVLKALGELGARAQDDFSIQGAAVACAPFDQEANARALAQPGINRDVYTNSLLKSLKAKALDQWYKYAPPEERDNNPVIAAAIAEYNKGLAARMIDWASKVAARTQFSSEEDPELKTLIQDSIVGHVAELSGYWNRYLASHSFSDDSTASVAAQGKTHISMLEVAPPQQRVVFAAKQVWQFGTAGLGQVQRGVPRSTIFSAAIGTSLIAAPFLGSGHSPSNIVATGLVAAFLTVQQGPLGISLRLLGTMFTTASYVAKVAWEQAVLMKEEEEEQVNQKLLLSPPKEKQQQQPQLPVGQFPVVTSHASVSSSSVEVTDCTSNSSSLTDHNDSALGTKGQRLGQQQGKRFDVVRALGAKTITEFDDAFIAPIYGFEDCWDYYRQTSSTYYLEEILVPTLVLNAADDPFFDPAVFPVEKTIIGGGRAPIKMVKTANGGHLGFCFHQVGEDDDDDEFADSSGMIGWMPRELARFLKHVQLERAKGELRQRQQLTLPRPSRREWLPYYTADQQQKPQQSD